MGLAAVSDFAEFLLDKGQSWYTKQHLVDLYLNLRGSTVSMTQFQRRMRAASLSKAERTWFPKWLDGYMRHCRMKPDQDLPVNESLVIGFLRSLRDNRVATWRRLQAARAIELYQAIIPTSDKLDFTSIKQ